MRKTLGPTAGDWNFACDSYGKVRHSKKACVFTVIRGEKGGDQIIKVAAQIPNWTDARLIANAKRMRAQLERTLADIADFSAEDGNYRFTAEVGLKIEAEIKDVLDRINGDRS